LEPRPFSVEERLSADAEESLRLGSESRSFVVRTSFEKRFDPLAKRLEETVCHGV